MPSVTAKQAALVSALRLDERLTVRLHEAAALTGMSLNKLQTLCYSGELKSRVVGRSRLIDAKALHALVVGEEPPRRRRRQQQQGR